ncbi:MAG: YeeE/YedE family protein [Kiloniellales bacterium]|nr:YeeE/YedE family protein [Kiloniellales bacterium]
MAVQAVEGLNARSPNRLVVGVGVAVFALGLAALAVRFGGRQAALFGIGVALGLVLYHALFGFAGSWRALVSEGRGAGLRAQMAMLALASLLFFPALDAGSLFGHPVGGAVAPVGTSVLVGAFLFGLGMQFGGGCASGTLYTVGGGNTKMLATLIGFLAGSVLGTLHLPWWLDLPSLGAISLLKHFSLVGALSVQLAVIAAIALISLHLERRRHGSLSHGPSLREDEAGWRRLLQGPWPLIAGGVLLAVLNFAVLAVSGHPWSVSFGYALWGAKLAQGLGLGVADWAFWTWPYPATALAGSVFAEDTSLSNFGILLGAFLAAGLAGRFAPQWRVPFRILLVAFIGGILMGYGARLAFGCNIGALFSGIASGSLHGWLWMAAALAGTVLGVPLARRALGRGS